MLIVSCALIYDDANRACAVSTVTADRTGKIVLLTYSLPNSISLFYRSSFGWCTFSALIWLAPGAEAKLQCTSEKSRLIWMQKNTPVPRLKAFLVKKKGTKTAVLSRVAKLRSVVALLHGWAKWSQHCVAHLKGWEMKQKNNCHLGIESRWCLNHVHDLFN